MNKYIIYGLIDPRTSEVRYIGKSTSGLSRPKRHLNPTRYNTEHNYKSNWIKSLMDIGIVPVIVILKTADSAEELSQLEIDTIAEYRSNGANLTNLTDGGEGSLGWVPTEETKANISAGRAKYLASLTEPLKAPNKKEHIMINDIAHKQCTDCHKVLPLDKFGTENKNWDKHKKVCKVCNAKRTAKWRAGKPTETLTPEQLKQSYIDRKDAMLAGQKRTMLERGDEIKAVLSVKRSKPLEATNITTGEKLYFNSALEANNHGFNNTNIHKALKANVPYKGYIWKFI